MNSRESFVAAYQHARTVNENIPSLKHTDGISFENPIYLLHLSGRAGCIVSESSHEIATLFNGGKKGLGKEVLKAAIAHGGTWLYATVSSTRLVHYYQSLGFEEVFLSQDWRDLNVTAMSYLALPGHRDDVRIKLPNGCAKCLEVPELCRAI
jgi:hypothetical protein